jgi:D-alanyl-D-alanine carboxypeptidase (penicillin-binding protein 5/6)
VKGCKSIDAQFPLYGSDKKLDTSRAAMLYEVNSDTTMYAWNPDERLSPASLIKMVTCMVVLEHCDIEEKLVVTESAMSTISKSAATIKLIPGEEFTVNQMLNALMVGSANDAAVVLAEHVAGNQESFVAMMNQWVMDHGCTDTNIVNAHGLHDDRQYTTARDMVRITAEAIKNEQFVEYFGTTAYKIAATEYSDIRRVETTNYLITIGTELYYDSRVTGGRTGITNDGKRSLVATAQSGGLNYIVVVLSATSTYDDKGNGVQWFGSYEEAEQLLDMGFKSHSITQVLYEGQILSQFPVNNGRNEVALGPVRSADVILPADATMDDLTLRFNIPNGTLQAPVDAGMQLSNVEVWYGSVCVAYSPVVTMNGSELNDGPLLQENRYGGNSKVWIILLIILIVAAVIFVLVIFAMRTVRTLQMAQQRMRHRRRRQDRRRTK